MSFGLKNASATYQSAMQMIFDDMLHKHVECYVDDLVVKSKKKYNHLKDLKLILDCLGKYQLRMNPLKCAFDITLEKFLGCIVRHRGIEVDHSKMDDQSCQNVFDSIKKHPLNPLILSAHAAGKPLILYIAAQETSLGALLAQENDKGKECALYYLSRTLTGAELNYSPIQKICLTLFFAIDKLRHYMQAFTIHLVAKADPVKYILSRPVISRHLVKWAIILQQYYIVYIPQKAVKGQALADFLADHPVPSNWKLCDDLPNEEVLFVEIMEPWIMFFDGATQRSGASEFRMFFISLEKHILPYSFKLEFRIKYIEIFGDSKLILNQPPINMRFDGIILEHIPRSENKKADALANLVTALTVLEDVSVNISLCQKWIVPLIEIQYEEADMIFGLLLRCLEKEESTKALEEAHSDICGAHQSGPKLQHQLKRMGYYWPTMIHDLMHFAKYGIPHRIVTDNGRKFANTLMDKLCEKFDFKQYKSSLYNAAENGLAEAFNKTLCSLLKKVVSKTKRDWKEKIGESLWAYRTTHRTPTGVTHYSLVYGIEAVLPLEREIPSLRMTIQEGLTTEDNAKLRLQELEALDEKRLEAQQALKCYQA
ncbi:uncharacterized protein E5676_scaffold436G00080 [Cucumis melo var. makuwa]|uniref:Integrase catalytic domain-containing protein n=1 Tax=Cucumis melo var. makuwa TaxID=1194695 RepID=A0A5D3DQ63_CUCMM|nr:uncharacterized protein E5676_scaffold436G00080 [Cucumis melo var. makuwa]